MNKLASGALFSASCLFYILSDLLLLAALLEQLVWQSEHSTLLTPLLFCFMAACLLAGIEAGSCRKRLSLPPLSLLFTLAAVSLLTFISLVSADEHIYSWLFGEPTSALSLQEIGVLVLLFCFLLAARRGVVFGTRLFPSSAIIACLGLLVWRTWDRVIIYDLDQYLETNIPSPLLWILVLLCVRIILARHDQTRSSLARKFSLCERGLASVCALCIGIVLTWSLVLVLQQPLQIKKTYPFQVKSEFLVMLLVSEDPIFSFHTGIDFKRLRDALRELIEKGQYGRGGSTISMQLAKVKYLNNEKTLLRKARQITAALWLEFFYNKESLIWDYINSVPFGPEAVGVERAAKRFFAKAPLDLSNEQSLQLVLSIYNPLEFNPSIQLTSDIVRNRSFVIRSRARRNFSRFLTQLSDMPFASR